MKDLFHPVLIASALWPALSFAQSIFIDSPSEGETLIGPTVTVRMSVSDFDSDQDGRIRIQVDGYWVEETERLRATVAVPRERISLRRGWLTGGASRSTPRCRRSSSSPSGMRTTRGVRER